ncbi:MAG TPA: tetratricopeptide repeat protein [Gemmatimonadaceae bacterium]|nr:tetratricopeptide repeat protein [Gemmatimonadaceae bacterium]
MESARKLVELARAAERDGDPDKSLALFDDAIARLQQESDPPFLADVLRWKGTVYRERGETEAAYQCYKRSLALAERIGADSAKAHALNCLAIVAQRRGDLRDSEIHYTAAAELAAQAGNSRLLGMIEQNRGVLMNMTGNFAAAEVRYFSSLSAFEEDGDEEAVSWVLNNIGILYTKLGHYQRAVETLERGLDIARRRGDGSVESILTLNLAEALATSGKLDVADEMCRKSLEEARRRNDRLTIAAALKCRARIERERGAFRQSMATLRIGIFEAEGLDDRLLHAEMLREFGQTSRALGESAEARLAWQEAADSFQDVGAIHEAAEIRSLLASLPSEPFGPGRSLSPEPPPPGLNA